MTSEEILSQITDENIVDILEDLGSDYPFTVNDGLLFNTVCHNHDKTGKKKLHYRYESKTFYCYTECHSIGNIFQLVMKTKECSYAKAREYVCSKVGIDVTVLKYGFTEAKVDNSFIKKFKQTNEEIVLPEVRDEKVLDYFWSNLFHESWIKDFITIETMKKFNIRYDITGNRIIIPHYNKDNQLIGIRCRNFDQEKVDDGKKYMPIVVGDVVYKYLTSLNLYGLNFTKHAIRKYRKILIGESEKFVMQHVSYYGDESIAVAISGSALSEYQIKLMRELDVQEVIIALDKEFTNENEAAEYRAKIQDKFINPLIVYFTVSVIWDKNNDLELKMAPTDKGKETFDKLFKERIIL